LAAGSTIRFASSLLIGAAIGVASAHYMAQPSNPLVNDRHGNWYTWPGSGDPESSPYSQARFLLDGQLPEYFAEVTTLYRSRDDDGGRLSQSCVYLVSMKRPEVRRWTLSLVDEDDSATSLVTQDDVVSTGGTVEVRLASVTQPGNWLAFGNEGAGRLVLRLYDGEDRPSQAEIDATLPKVTRERCL
jgi:hypothetical protein